MATNWESLLHGRLQEARAHRAVAQLPDPGSCSSLEKVHQEASDPTPVSSLGYYQVVLVYRGNITEPNQLSGGYGKSLL